MACSRCGGDKEAGRKHSWCKACYNTEHAAKYGKKWKKANPEKAKAKHKRQAEAFRRRKGQGGVGSCEVCGRIARMCRDHNHNTGQIRGRLCMQCNTSLGHAGDSAVRLRQLADYLDEWGRKWIHPE